MKNRTVKWLSLLLIVLFSSLGEALPQEDYQVFRSSRRGEKPDQILHKYLTRLVYKNLDSQAEVFAKIETQADVRQRGKKVRKLMIDALGNWPPQRTPLHATITGRVNRERYRIEKLVFQSRPGFYVTANLYLPPPTMGDGPFPAVLGPCGHTMLGKAFEPYQKVYSTLASQGFVVLTYDPPGQGERLMYYEDSLGESLLKSSTIEHTMAGIQCYLSGSNAAAYFIWDGIRGIDYLTSRPEVDTSRIAVTGNSGGGNLTAYIAALDDRVSAAAPTCYITSWRAMWDTYGMADAEQNLLPVIAKGFGYHDYIMPFVPKPYLINAGIQDFFSIRGTRETAGLIEQIYEIYDKASNFMLFESDEGHGYTRPRREATYSWLGKHLAAASEPPVEPEMQPEPVRSLWASPTGQVSTSYDDAETIGSLNLKRTQLYRIDYPNSVAGFQGFRKRTLETVLVRIGFERSVIPLDSQTRGFATPIDGAATVERLTFESEPGITLPALLVRASLPRKELPLVLYIPHRTKSGDLGDEIAGLANAGYNVLSVDLRGKGETERRDVRTDAFFDWFSHDWDVAMMALQLDKPLMTMRTLDIIRSVDFLLDFDSGKLAARGIVAIGKGSATIPLLHAAVLDERISGVVLESGLVSWHRMISDQIHRGQFDNVVPGALADYDLPVLAASLAPRPAVLSSLTDSMGQVLDPAEVSHEYELAVHCYQLLGQANHLRIMERPQGRTITEVYGDVLGSALIGQ
jgi:cephalosporin-C deacetylase-like acetyl esterase